MNNYCTLFDQTYLAKGLCLIESLRRHDPSCTLYVLAMDDVTLARLTAYSPGGSEGQLFVFSFAIERAFRFLGDEIDAARANRTWQEFCWTMASVWLNRSLQRGIDAITYLDADSYFFSSPAQAFSEIQDRSIALVPHRFAPEDEERFRPNGVYNANFVHVKYDAQGLSFARDWAKLSLDWCYYRDEPGRYGDQGYLTELAKRYRVHTIQNLGVNLGPWNQGKYHYRVDNGTLFVSDGQREDRLVMYHMHEFRSREFLTGWKLNPMVERYVYQPYLEAYERNEYVDPA